MHSVAMQASLSYPKRGYGMVSDLLNLGWVNNKIVTHTRPISKFNHTSAIQTFAYVKVKFSQVFNLN